MKYSAPLDGVRTIAIFPVLLFHAGAPMLGGGRIGVDVFFVLSGYLITRILVSEHERCRRIDIPRFYIRRLNRLWPPMLAMLVTFLAAGPFLIKDFDLSKNALDALVSAVYLADYARSFDLPPSHLLHMWSLSIEEHFYLLWPIILLGLLRLERRHAVGALLFLFLIATAWRNSEFTRVGWLIYHRLDTHASGILLGCLAGLLRWRLPAYFAILGLLGIVATIIWTSYDTQFRLATVGFTAAEVSAVLLVTSQPNWLGAAPLAWIGKMSYGIYLWHYPAARVVRQYDIAWETQFVVITVFGAVMAAASYYTLEAHFRRRRSRSVDRDANNIDVMVVVGPGRARAGVE